MPFNILEAKKKSNEVLAEVREINKKVVEEKRELTTEEKTLYGDKIAEIRSTQRDIELAELENPSIEARKVISDIDPTDHLADEFRNIGEFMSEAIKNPGNEKFSELREAAMSAGVNGGLLIPKKFVDSILAIDPQDSIVRSRATVIPAGDYPDAEITVPALDQQGDQDVYAGIKVYWTGEGNTIPESSAKTRNITLKPHEVTARVVLTNKFMNNATAAASMIEGLMRKALMAAEDAAFLTGNGISKPLGILKSSAALKVNRAVSNQIAYADLTTMYAKAKMGGKLSFVGSQSIIPQTMGMKDEAGHLIYARNATDAMPESLVGKELLFNERSPILGTLGDLAMIDFAYYLIKDGSGLFLQMSDHEQFSSNKTVVKLVWNVDGQPWINKPLKLENGDIVSPFVLLDVPEA